MSDFDPATLFSVKGLVAVVTGGGTGIGLMIAQCLEENGAIVYILGRRQEVLDKAASTAKHGNILPIRTDVTLKSDLSAAVSNIESKHGFINLLIANSGIEGPNHAEMPKEPSLADLQSFLYSHSPEDFNQTFAVNTTAVYYTVVAFLDLLGKGNEEGNAEQKSQVIAVSSAAAFNRVPFAGYAYGASKAGVLHMMKQFATNLVPYSIRSNIIAPGLYPSEMTEKIMGNTKVYPKDFIPAQRAGKASDMAGAVLFLCSTAGSFVNGNVLVTDGGRLSVMPSTY